MTLAELRKAQGMTQVQLAAAMGVRQPAVSRIEHHPDRVGLSLLRRYVEGLGGRLEISIRWSDDSVTRLAL